MIHVTDVDINRLVLYVNEKGKVKEGRIISYTKDMTYIKFELPTKHVWLDNYALKWSL